MDIEVTSDIWWKNAVIYCIDVEAFLDWDGDGCGDFAGLTKRIDYLAGIGVTCLWLMPFYPSPHRDDGYDVTDMYAVHPRMGHLGDVSEFLRTARDRGLRVIADLVVNHTSDQHPWFQSARSDPQSPYRDFFIWRDEPGDSPDGLVFPGQEESNWAWDEEAGQYYLHRFYSHQPDLNILNPAVRDEIAKVIGFWMQMGLAGFRLDAVPFLLETAGVDNIAEADPHDYLRALRAFMGRRRGDAVLLGEVNLPPAQQRTYFGDESGDELHMVFNFTANQAMYLALAREDATPLIEALEALPEIPPDCQWANFVRNHDELTLDKLSDEEREEVFAAFGPDESMQIFGRGLRRRLPSMLSGDQRRIRLVYSLLFTLPGTPVLFYGEEIGMAENLDVPGRLSVRTPMQWSDEPNGGFSTAEPSKLVDPVVEGEYGPQHVNVTGQRRDAESLLNWMERIIRRRKECPEFGWGRWSIVDTGTSAALAHRCDWHDRTVVAVHNFSGEPLTVTLPMKDDDCESLVDLLAERVYGPPDGEVRVDLDAYGYRWLRIRKRGQRLAA